MARNKQNPPVDTSKEVNPIPIEDEGSPPGALSIPLQQPQPGLLAQPQMPAAASAFLAGAGKTAPAPSSVPVIQIDHKGAAFILPSGEVVESIRGFPVYYFQTRSFYLKPPQPGQKGQPPDCWSRDLIEPDNGVPHRQSEKCCNCDKAVFGSGKDGRSQACSVKTWIFLVNPEFGNPPIGVLVAPPSSLSVLFGNRFKGGFFQQAQHRFGAYQIAWTEFGLVRGGELHCLLAPKIVQGANEEQAGRLAALHRRFHDDMERMRGTVAEVHDEPEDEPNKEAS